jgi:hypothetical protein
MKVESRSMSLLVLLLFTLAPFGILAQTYSISWFKVAGGGGTSTDSQFAVNGTIGQPDANQLRMVGGDYSLTGGFWSSAAVQMPGAPILTIVSSSTNLLISWPSPSTGFVLEQIPAVGLLNWVSVTNLVSDDGMIRSVTVAISSGNRFYRLKK